MPRYFFVTRIGSETIPDPEGMELRDADHAWSVARALIRDLLGQKASQKLMGATLDVRDSDGEIVLEFPFSEALLDTMGKPSAIH